MSATLSCTREDDNRNGIVIRKRINCNRIFVQ